MQLKSLQEIEKGLIAKRKELKGNGSANSLLAVGEIQGGDEGELSSVSEIIEFGNIEGQNKAEQIAAITAALTRISEGTYEQCVDCLAEGKSNAASKIPAARLKAMPTTQRCVEHQAELEQNGGAPKVNGESFEAELLGSTKEPKQRKGDNPNGSGKFWQ